MHQHESVLCHPFDLLCYGVSRWLFLGLVLEHYCQIQVIEKFLLPTCHPDVSLLIGYFPLGILGKGVL